MRYFFDLTDGGICSRDEEGAIFKSWPAAEAEAVKVVADVARDARSTGDFEGVSVAVRDEAGQTVLSLVLRLDITRLAPDDSVSAEKP